MVLYSQQIPAGSVLLAQGPLFGVALAISGECMRTRIYVDGFNLYYGAVKESPFKWLDLVELARQILPPGHTIEKVKYFTARVSGATDSGAPARQQIYINALRTLPEVEIYFGNFLSKTVWRPLTNLPIAGKQINSPAPVTLPAGNHAVVGQQPQRLPIGSYPISGGKKKKKRRKPPKPLPDALIAEVHTMEEKGSDVNLAAHLLNDAWKGLFDVAAVISNDTDLVTPIRMVTTERNKVVHIVCTGRWQAAPRLAAVASHVRHIRPTMLRASQFPNPIPNTTISKPAGW